MTVRNLRLRFCQSYQSSEATTEPNAAKQRVKQSGKRAEQQNRAPRVLDGEKEAHPVALACSAPPEGAERWTLRLLRDHLIEMQVVGSVARRRSGARRKTELKPWLKQCWFTHA
jgi:hypothetical protein